MSKTIVHQVISIDGATLVVFVAEAHYWQLGLISALWSGERGTQDLLHG